MPIAALLTVDSKLSGKARWSIRARFDRKTADFLVCERLRLKAVAIIELDDGRMTLRPTGTVTPSRRRRDTKTFRFQSKRKPSEPEIAALFHQAQAGG